MTKKLITFIGLMCLLASSFALSGVIRGNYTNQVAHGEDFKYFAQVDNNTHGIYCTYLFLDADGNIEQVFPYRLYRDVGASEPQGYSLLTGVNGTVAVRTSTIGLLTGPHTFKLLCDGGYEDEVYFQVGYAIVGEAPQLVVTALLANLGNIGWLFLGFIVFVIASLFVGLLWSRRDEF